MDQSGVNVLSGVSTKKKSRYGLAVLLQSMLKIGVIGFGGGSALIPVIEEEVVERQRILSHEEYNEAVVSACLTPGALPVEIAAGVGRKKNGIRGMLLCALCMAVPGAFLTIFILIAAAQFEGEALDLIRYISIGLGGFIVSLLASYGLKTAGEAKARGRKSYTASLLIMLGVFLLTGGRSLLKLLNIRGADVFPRLSTFQVLVLSFSVMFAVYVVTELVHRNKTNIGKSDDSKNGIGKYQNRSDGIKTDLRKYQDRSDGSHGVSYAGSSIALAERNVQYRSVQGKPGRKEVLSILTETLIWVLFAAICSIPALFLVSGGPLYILRGFLSSLMSFGGGDAYLSVADGLFVNTHMVSSDTFYGLLVPVANVLPGSILCKILTGTGYLIGSANGVLPGIAGAVAGFAVSTAASGMVFGVIYWIFCTFENVSFFRMVSRWIRPIISGLLAGVMVTLLKTAASTAVSLGHSGSIAMILTIIIAAVDIFLSQKKTDHTLLLIGSAAAGALVLLF